MDVTRNGVGCRWFVEGDIKGCFDNIDHSVLLDILREKIRDGRFLQLVENLLKAGYCEFWQYNPTLSGTPQGGVVSPLLANIYLDRLDSFVETNLEPAYTRGKGPKEKPRVGNGRRTQVRRHRKDGNLEKVREWEKARRLLPPAIPTIPASGDCTTCDTPTTSFCASSALNRKPEEIKERLRSFLLGTLKLELSEEKTLVTHAACDAAKFLGYEIHRQQCDTKLDRNKTRSTNGVLALKVPRDVVKAACDRYLKNGKTTNRPEILGDSDFDIVLQYQWHYAGLVDYYLLAQNVANFGKLRYIMETSLLKTLANKHRASVGEVWRKHKNTVRTPDGPRRCIKVVIERPDKQPLTAVFGGLSLRRQVTAVLKDHVPIRRPRRTEILKRLLANACEVCGSSDQVEVHHVRKLSDLQKMGRKALPDWARIMIARKRKTLVLCKSCHGAVHAGRPLPQRVST